jgi:organic radical activating enzyme
MPVPSQADTFPAVDTTAVRYPVMERFLTVQGEGYWTGTLAWFIRLGGCDVGCVWCDVKESWDATAHPSIPLTELVAEAAATAAPIVVITGGEPTLHPLRPLVEALQAVGKRVHLETAGTNPTDAPLDWITFSPKKFKPPVDDYLTTAHELKVVVYNPKDLPWAEDWYQRSHQPRAFLQPEWSKPESATWILDYIQTHPHWRISLQTHKYLSIR